jgi:hypothetical protein
MTASAFISTKAISGGRASASTSGGVASKDAFAVLSQLRNLDSQRLYQKISHVDADLLTRIKKTASRMNFG